MGPLELGINRLGRDENEFGTQTLSAADCSKRCVEDDACRAMSFMGRPPPVLHSLCRQPAVRT
jgi:hypothetical protein